MEFLDQFAAEWPTTYHDLVLLLRMLLAMLVGLLPGLQRESSGHPAGRRTHILVALGSAMLMMIALESGAAGGDLGRVVAGVATGIGFIGGGTILKSTDKTEVQGVTTAASIWLTAALGVAVGLGLIWLPIVGSLLALFVLAVLRKEDRR